MARTLPDGSKEGHQELLDRRFRTLGEALMFIEQPLARLEEEYIIVKGISIRCPARAGFDWLVVIRADSAEGPVVGFFSGSSLFEAMSALTSKLADKTIAWRVDKYGGQG